MSTLAADSHSREPLDDPHWAWQPYVPDAARPWNPARAAHLYRRAACGGTWDELQLAVAAGPQATLDLLMSGDATAATAFYAEARSTIKSLLGFGDPKDLPAWWLFVMLETPHPLLERLTLFWHGHFATSAAKVTDQNLMFAQNELLRTHALGRFGDLLRAMMRDTAMLLWLDSAVNRKSRPNENFAREVMELFTLGTGHYTERDIKEAARCFTGWEVHNNRFWFNGPQHDEGVKTVLGERGNFDGDELVGILLKQPAAARFLVRKLFRFFVADEPPAADDAEASEVAGTPNSTAVRPSDDFIEPLARQLRESDYDVAGVVRTMLASNYFHSSAVVGRRIKGPVDFAVGLIRSLEGHVDHYALARDLAALGQQLFYPPNVKGWNGGREWINAYTLLSRTNLVERLTSGRGPYERKLGLDESPALADLASDATDGRAPVRRLCELLLAVAPPEAVVDELAKIARRRAGEDEFTRRGRALYALASLPEFQLL